MKVEKLINTLEGLKNKLGNVEVCTTDVDGNYAAYIRSAEEEYFWNFENSIEEDIILLVASW